MGRTHNYKSMRRLLEQHGHRMVRGGKHGVKMVKAGARPITLPTHRGEDYSRGLTSAILREADVRDE